MISLWRICFSLVLLTAFLPGESLKGKVQLAGSGDPAVRGRSDYSGVVVWLEPLDLPPDTEAGLAVSTMVQKDKKFSPHVLAIPLGGTVEFPNLDPIYHNAFSNFSGQPFDIGLYPPGTKRTVRFKHAGVVRVFCNIHPAMSAVIVVLKTPYFAVSNYDGAFEIKNVPAGKYRLRVFHERALPATLEALEHEIVVGPASLSMPLLTVSETGYLPAPHQNKYGHDYPPAVEGYRLPK